jgi:hypothetical protein
LIVHHWFHDKTESTLYWRRRDQIEALSLPLFDPFWHMIHHFNEAVRTDGSPLATAQDGLHSLTVALALQRSLREQLPVHMATSATYR